MNHLEKRGCARCEKKQVYGITRASDDAPTMDGGWFNEKYAYKPEGCDCFHDKRYSGR
jgi:hypothetical protein